MRIQEAHTKESGGIDCMIESESEVWEGMEGGMVWCGVDDKSKGRVKEGCALLMSHRVWEGVE